MALLCGGGGDGSPPPSPPSGLPGGREETAGGATGRGGYSGPVSSHRTVVGVTSEKCHFKAGRELFITEDTDQGACMMDGVIAMQNPSSPEQIHKQGPRLQQRWQNYIETNKPQRQTSSEENLLADGFSHLCSDLRDNLSGNNGGGQSYSRLRADSFSSGLSSSSRGSVGTTTTELYSGSMPRSPGLGPNIQRSAFSHGTLPRSPARKWVEQHQNSNYPDCGTNNENRLSPFTLSTPPVNNSGVSWQSRPAMTLQTQQELQQQLSPARRLSFSSQNLPTGIAEVERMYTAMKNLNTPLPNAPHLDGSKMPTPYSMNHGNSEEIDQSDVASVMGEIPPPPPPVQSHAVLESGLGHQIPVAPRTPGTLRKINSSNWPKPPNMPLPPLPPKRTSSRLSEIMRPNNLNLSHDSDNSIYSRPKPFLHRTSLMSTGSSDSGGSSAPSDPELPMSPISPSSELMFTWPNYSIGAPSPTEHRSVSQAGSGERDNINTSMISHSSQMYMKMSPMAPVFDDPDTQYMNLLYSAVQRQGGSGSVETAMSPYLEMTATNNLKKMRNGAIDSVSAIYAQIESSGGSSENLNQFGGLQGVAPMQTAKQRGKAPTGKSKSIQELRELMIEMEKKRYLRVGLNLFNTNPDIGIDYLVKQNFVELSPLSVAKFLFKTPALAKQMIGEYLGQIQSAFCMKVLSVFMDEFDFSGLRIDKALRKLIKHVKFPSEAIKIEKIMEVFGKRFTKTNPNIATKFKSVESIATLAFQTFCLNVNLHSLNLKPDNKMLEKDFITKLKAADNGHDFDQKILKAIYKGVKKSPFTPDSDHVSDTNKIQANVESAPKLAEMHRRLVCICSLVQVRDINSKKEVEANHHTRDIYLFNDRMVILKKLGKSDGNQHFRYQSSLPLNGMEVTLFHTPVFKYGIQVSRKADGSVLTTLNADSEQDRYKFVVDLQEAIFEMDLMESAMRDANLIK